MTSFAFGATQPTKPQEAPRPELDDVELRVITEALEIRVGSLSRHLAKVENLSSEFRRTFAELVAAVRMHDAFADEDDEA